MSDSNTSKAKVSQVPFGNTSIEGLMLPDGSFAVGISQLVDLNLIPPNRSLKQLEALLDKRFQSHQKVKSELHPKAVNTISLIEFEEVIVRLALKGNEAAIQLTLALVGLSLTQLFSDAFGVRFEGEDRQNYLIERMKSKQQRRTLTDAIQDYIFRNEPSENYCKFIYSNVSDCLNRKVFGKASKDLREEKGIASNELLRDSFTVDELYEIGHIENMAMKLIDRRGVEPLEAMKQALALIA